MTNLTSEDNRLALTSAPSIFIILMAAIINTILGIYLLALLNAPASFIIPALIFAFIIGALTAITIITFLNYTATSTRN